MYMWMLELFRDLATKPSSEFLGKPFTLAVQSSRLHAKPISRSKQQSAVASAAYRSGEKLLDKRIDETFDYTRKQAIEATRIMAPSSAPDWVLDRATLWNTVEATEKRKDAQLAREVQVAIPDELPKGHCQITDVILDNIRSHECSDDHAAPQRLPLSP